jgi:hypothetical protein
MEIHKGAIFDRLKINIILCLKIGFSLNFYAVIDGHHSSVITFALNWYLR